MNWRVLNSYIANKRPSRLMCSSMTAAMQFGRMGIGWMIEWAGEAAKRPFPVHVHMVRHSTGYALAGRGYSVTWATPQ